MSGWRHGTEGAQINRAKPLSFTFDGMNLTGFEGDTLASALLASGVQILGRSFKYHRPRGLWGMGAEEPNAIIDVVLGAEHWPNCRATTTPLRDGMVLRSVNAAPDAARDRFSLMDRFHRFIPAGFYYKTFMALPWLRYEPVIRRMAGLGRVSPGFEPPADVPQINTVCDLMVIGAGPAGLAAASAGAEAGRSVWLIDDGCALGGSLRWRGGLINGADWRTFRDVTEAAVLANGGRVLKSTTLWGAFDHGLYAAWQKREGTSDVHWRIRAKEVILAAGALERPVWFANNDLPGVMSAEAAFYFLKVHGTVVGRKLLLVTGNDATLPIVEALREIGCEVTLADVRQGAKLTAAKGRHHVTGAVVNGEVISCDAILCSGGYTPTVHLWCQTGGKLDWDSDKDALVPRLNTSAMKVVGAAKASFTLSEALGEGFAAAGGQGAAPNAPAEAQTPSAIIRPDPALTGRQWIDMQNDVTLKDVGIAAREGFTSVEHLKRYTTLGMATDQGRSANFAGLATMAAVTERSIPETGTTTYRPPFEPVPLRVIAGRRRGELFNPPKRLLLESGHRGEGAKFREYGGWMRPSVYGTGPEEELAQIEARVARESVAVFDASPLGKLEVVGPKASELLDFTGYVRMSTLKQGRARYGFMLGENGIVHDDGVVLRLADDRFILSASSSHVDSVRFILEDARQDRLGRKGVAVHDVTQGLVTLTVTGPKADQLLRRAGIGLPEMAHMSVIETEFEGRFLRIARISFTGDKSYELSVLARHGAALHALLTDVLAHTGGRWIGLEAVMILRAEKGYILVGKDTDGLTMPHDLGWVGPRNKRGDEYIGKRSLFTPEAKAEGRRQLVGLEAEGVPLVTGAHLVPITGARRSLGFVTSSYMSPNLGRPIALALMEEGRAQIGSEVAVFNDGQVRVARVALPCAYDVGGERLNG
jgi:sarcosine oxidase, subunit alpha